MASIKKVVLIEDEDGCRSWMHHSSGKKTCVLRKYSSRDLPPDTIEFETVIRGDNLCVPDGLKVVRLLSLSEVTARIGRASSKAYQEYSHWHDVLEDVGRIKDWGEEPATKTIKKREGPAENTVVPETELGHLYKSMKYLSLETQLAVARDFSKRPGPTIAKAFNLSVMKFSSFQNSDEGFRPETSQPDMPVSAAEITSTDTLTAALCNEEYGRVTNDSTLDFEFVERELVPDRVTGRGTRGRRVDWLLSNRSDRTPIVAEVKVADDQNPFYGLVQGLMYAAMLRTTSQRRRLAKYHEGRILVEDRAFDIYIVLYDYNTNSTRRVELLEATSEIAAELVKRIEIATHIRRIVCVEGKQQDGKLVFEKLFAHAVDEDASGRLEEG